MTRYISIVITVPARARILESIIAMLFVTLIAFAAAKSY
jgi:hypothetical protein